MGERGYSAAEYRQREQERFDALIVTERCALCPEWSYTGTALEGREMASQHRAQAHPELRPKRYRKQHHLGRFRQPPLDREDEAEIMAERLKRARLHGIENDLDSGYTQRVTPSL